MVVFRFGVLQPYVSGSGKEWTVTPLPDAEGVWAAWCKLADASGWIAPNLGKDRVWCFAPSHSLTYSGASPLDFEAGRDGVASFLVYALGLVHEADLQHENRFVTGAKKAKPTSMLGATPASLGHLLDVAPDWYSSQQHEVQIAATSALLVHNQLPSYTWDWQRFAWQYIVFDGLWYCAVKSGRVTGPLKGNHEQRLSKLAAELGLHSDSDEFGKWIDYRNDLLHQVTWGGEVPGRGPDRGVYSALRCLRNFCVLAFLAMVGVRSSVLSDDWRGFMPRLFDVV